MTSQASEVRQFRSRSREALRTAARRTGLITRGVERRFWTGVLIGMRWGKGRLRQLHGAFDQMVTRVEYRAGRSADTAGARSAPATTTGAGNNGDRRPSDRVSGFSPPAV